MKLAALVLVPLFAAASATAAAAPHHGPVYRGVAKSAMIAAAKAAPLKLIDYLETYCDGETSIGDWLQALAGAEPTRIDWTAGPCELVTDLNPLDAGGDYCVQASLRLKRPKNPRDIPEIEIYLERPKHGRPGAVYAFRAAFAGPDGLDYIRERRDFEAQWRERFKDAAPAPCTDE